MAREISDHLILEPCFGRIGPTFALRPRPARPTFAVALRAAATRFLLPICD
jgi:hypothetical protein